MDYILTTFDSFDVLDTHARCVLEKHASYKDACYRLWSKWEKFMRDYRYALHQHSMIYYIIEIDNDLSGRVVNLGRVKSGALKDDGGFELLRRMLP